MSLFRDPPMTPPRSDRVYYEYERHLLDTHAQRRAEEKPRRAPVLARVAAFVGLRKSA